MQTMTRWTDDRMDDLKQQVDEIGRRIDRGFASQREEMNARFDRMEAQFEARFEKVDERFEKIDERFDKVDARFERVDEKFERVGVELNRTQEMVIGLHATITRLSVTLLAVVAGLVVTRLA
jgi:archaellum component FlaC